jgi:hypothetical protein
VIGKCRRDAVRERRTFKKRRTEKQMKKVKIVKLKGGEALSSFRKNKTSTTSRSRLGTK